MRSRILLAAGLLLLTPPLAAVAHGQESWRWTLRGYGARVDGSDDDITTAATRPGGVAERTKFGLDGGGDGFGLGIEYRFTELVGLELAGLFADIDSSFVLDLDELWGMDDDEVDFEPITLGVNFHLTRGRRVDFFLGPLLAFVDYGDASFQALGERIRRSFEDDEFAPGINLGIDVPFTRSSPWAFTAGLRYIDTDAELRGGSPELAVDPLIATAGIAYRFGPFARPEPEPAPAPLPPPPPPAPEPEPEPTPAPAPPPPAPEPKPEEREVVYFDPGSTRVSNIAKAKLDEVALKMKQDPELRAWIIGHTDSTGSDRTNQRISEKRAEAVKSYLVERHGIDASRISTEGRGAGEPAAANDTAEGRRLNRRAVIILKVE